jgi:hypothetical protein
LTQYDEQTEKQLRVLRIITWLFMLVGPCAYLAIAQLIDAKGVEARAGNEILLYLLLAVAIVNPFFAPLIVRAETSKFRKGLSQVKSPAQLFFTLSIIQMAMVEATYIYGLVVFLLTGKLTNMLYFYVIGIAWSFVFWPRREKYTQLLEKLNRP